MINIYIFRSRLSWVNSSFHPQNQFENFLKEVNEVFTDYHGRAFREHFLGCQVWLRTDTDQLEALLVAGRVVEHGGHQVDGDREHDRGVVLRCNAAQGLEVPQLMQTRVIYQILCSIIRDCKKSVTRYIEYPVLYEQCTIYFYNPLCVSYLKSCWAVYDDLCCMLESFAGLVLALGCNNLSSGLPGSLRLGSHGSLQVFRNSDILHLHPLNSYTPSLCCNFQWWLKQATSVRSVHWMLWAIIKLCRGTC